MKFHALDSVKYEIARGFPIPSIPLSIPVKGSISAADINSNKIKFKSIYGSLEVGRRRDGKLQMKFPLN
jgi:glucose dehydrogenase